MYPYIIPDIRARVTAGGWWRLSPYSPRLNETLLPTLQPRSMTLVKIGHQVKEAESDCQTDIAIESSEFFFYQRHLDYASGNFLKDA